MSRTAGVKLLPGRSGAAYLASARGASSMRAGGGACFVSVYLDGALLYESPPAADPEPGLKPGTRAEPPEPIDVNRLPVSHLAGVEFYPTAATAPIQFNKTSGGNCGVLLLWTRER